MMVDNLFYFFNTALILLFLSSGNTFSMSYDPEECAVFIADEK